MSVLRRRTRLVYFRVSEEEYTQLEDACQTFGLRSISDAVRTAVQNMVKQETDPPSASENQALSRVATVVSDLNCRIGRLLTALGIEDTPVIDPTTAEKCLGAGANAPAAWKRK